ncbi:MAG: tRNA dihydrouridine synthase DusB [Desulfatiglandaceae bacterium]
MLQIGNLILNNRLILAPMAGITNVPFRLIAKKMGVALVTTEMVSAAGLVRGGGRTFNYLKTTPREKPLAVQIFGSDPLTMAEAAKIVVQAGADMVDINMGCPARKVVRTGGGGALLQTPDLAAEMVYAVGRVCSVPLSVKMRAGWSPDSPTAPDIAALLEQAGAHAVTVHPRYVTQGFTGSADWTIISAVKERLHIPVIGNGDITTPQMALTMQKETRCDGVMVGRGAIGNPWLLRQILDLEAGHPFRQPTLAERRAIILAHFELLTDLMGEARASRAMRGHLLKYTRGLPYSSRFRGTFTGIKDLRTIIKAMDNYFSTLNRSTLPLSITHPTRKQQGAART